MIEKYELMSGPWLAKLEEILRCLVDASGDRLRGVEYSVNQVYTDPPPHLVQDAEAKTAGWWFRIQDGNLEFGTGEVPEADLKLIAPYDMMLPLARLVRAEDPTAMKRTVAEIRKGVAEGKVHVTFNGKPQPEELEPVHDLIARHTS